MTVSLKAFNEAFKEASRADKGLTKKHKEQLDALKDIAEAISAKGTFKAEVTDWLGAAAGLKITRAVDNESTTFRVGFGYEGFSGSATIALTSGTAHKPVGKPEGYALQYDDDQFLKALGTAVAERFAETRRANEALQYVKPAKTP